jgi:hypothetical protein
MEWARWAAIIVLAYPVYLIKVQVELTTPKVTHDGQAID